MSTVDTPALPVVGQDPWGDDLNAYLAYIDSRLGTVESQPNGAIMSFNFAPDPGMGPSSRAGFNPGEIRFNNLDQTQATAIMASKITESGADATLALASAVPGTVLVLQQTDDVKQYAMAIMSDDPVDMGDHFMLPVISVTLNSNPLIPGLTGLSAAGISQTEVTTGPQGPAGPQGLDGPQGPPGPQGIQGVQGEIGVEGPAGPAGATGPTGPAGPQGDLGPPGPQGDTGAAGASQGAYPLQWKVNTDATNPAHGYIKANVNVVEAVTEFYVSLYDKNGQAITVFNELGEGDTVTLYEAGQFETWNSYTVTGAPFLQDNPVDWVTVPVVYADTGPVAFTPGGNTNVVLTTPLRGVPGPPGSAGAQGVQGDPGPAGPTGPTGPQGTQGLTGQQGTQGLPGIQGPVGPPGPQGLAGTTGAAGPTGATGPAGAQGVQGPPGTAGAQGPTGATGPQGPAGTAASAVTNVSQASDRVVIANTNVETMLRTVTIPTVAVGDLFNLRLWGDIVNTAANYGYQWRLRLGSLTGAVLLDTGTNAVSTSAQPRDWQADIHFQIGAANSADLNAMFRLGLPSAGSVLEAQTVLGTVNMDAGVFNGGMVLVWTVQIATANANANCRSAGYNLRRWLGV